MHARLIQHQKKKYASAAKGTQMAFHPVAGARLVVRRWQNRTLETGRVKERTKATTSYIHEVMYHNESRDQPPSPCMTSRGSD